MDRNTGNWRPSRRSHAERSRSIRSRSSPLQELLRPTGLFLLPFPLAGGGLLHALAHLPQMACFLGLLPALQFDGSGEKRTDLRVALCARYFSPLKRNVLRHPLDFARKQEPAIGASLANNRPGS